MTEQQVTTIQDYAKTFPYGKGMNGPTKNIRTVNKSDNTDMPVPEITVTPPTPEPPKQFGPTFKEDFPAEMRRQLWPLCCGASILSGFKDVQLLSEEELVSRIQKTMEAVPDFQVYSHEKMKPMLTFLTLNEAQMNSPKITSAVAKAGFFKFMTAQPRSTPQGFYVRDDSKTMKLENI